MTLDEFRAACERRAAAYPRGWSIRTYGKNGIPWSALVTVSEPNTAQRHTFVRITAHDRDGLQGVEFECITTAHDAVVTTSTHRPVDIAFEDFDKILSMMRDTAQLIQSHELSNSTRVIPSPFAERTSAPIAATL